MAYVKTNWVDNTVKVSAENLNHIEDGIYNADTNANTAQDTANSAYSAATAALSEANSKYEKPSSGIPESDLTLEVRDKLKSSYPIVSSLTGWNQECRAGNITPDVVLPNPTGAISEEIRYIFTSATGSASFTAPIGYMISSSSFAGLSPRNSVQITGLTQGSIFEYSIIVIDSTHIGLTLIKEWATA